MLDLILSDENLALAAEQFQSGKGGCGIDGMYPSELNDYLALNKNALVKSIRQGSFQPNTVQQFQIVGKSGKPRVVSRLTVIDRFIQRACMQVLNEVFEPIFLPQSFAYQKGKGVVGAVDRFKTYAVQFPCILSIDIQNYFDMIPHDLLLQCFRRYVPDANVSELIWRFLRCGVQLEFETKQKTKGVIQGAPLSPLLSNLYLHQLDECLVKLDVPFLRYGDDVVLFIESAQQGNDLLQYVIVYLASFLSLAVNRKKTVIRKSMEHTYLGYTFHIDRNTGEIFTTQKKRDIITQYNGWHTDRIHPVDRDYHIMLDGVLSQKDYTLYFENEDVKKSFPIKTLDSLNVYSNVVFSSAFFAFAAKNALRVQIFDQYGHRLGAFTPTEHFRNIKLPISQLTLYADSEARLSLARKILCAAIGNMKANLRYYANRKKESALEIGADALGRSILKISHGETVEAILLEEARAREQYYACFDAILGKDGFQFDRRTRRPPQNPLNALLSFGNTVLYQLIATHINRSALDIRIGILHATNKRPESLNLDIAELFKPIVIDRVVFSMINRNMIDAKRHFECYGEKGIYLNAEGKSLFLREIQGKLRQKVQADGTEATYHYLIQREVWKFVSDHPNHG